jgi:hypothetical protein
MRTIRFVCLLLATGLYLTVLAPTASGRKPLCCWEYATFCANECQSHSGILTLDCPFPGFQICVCEDYYSPNGGPSCP